MLDVYVRQAQVQYRLEHVFTGQELADACACATHDGVFFDGHQQLMAGSHFANQFFIHRLDEAHVDHGGVDFLSHLQRFGQLHAEYQHGDFRTLATNHALADFQRLEVFFDRCVRPGTTRVTHGRRAFVEVTGGEHFAQFVLVARGHDDHARNATQVRQVVTASVGRAVFAHQARTVDGKQHVQILHGYVMHQLVVAALQECRIDRHYRLGTFACHAGRKGHRMLLGNRHVEVALWITLAESDQVRAFFHGRGDAYQALIGRSHVAQPFAEHS